MEQRISVVTLGVADLERSRRFYTEGLGWTPCYDTSEIVFYQAGPMVVGLFPRASLAADANAPSDGGTGSFALAQNVRSREDVDALLAQARSAGATISSPAQDKPWGGYSGYFADPDGHYWEIAWNPAFKFTPDGGVLFGI